MDDIAAHLSTVVDEQPTAVSELDGGKIGTVYRVEFDGRAPLVAKTSETPLSIEATMLTHLADRGLPVPEIVHATDDLLVLEHVDGDSAISPEIERDVADHLAALHDVTAPAYGFECDTLTGSLHQPNPWTDSWVDFYRDQRLTYATGVASEAGELPDSTVERVEALAADLDSLLVEPEAPALIHGDVWTTNLLASDGELRAFLDPAAYYAHAEIELAYMDWTGTVGDAFFDRYDERRGIDSGFESRRDAYVCYPLLSHVYHFGERYLSELDGTLARLGY
ncbi:fructosamine kinase family protein [Haladaptatus sp. DYF46]|uniref:fructosamine kinase family protein n=1 Tax=Haladaptatus sp. DYF46 TaxID=2886041 RepID=UPI001E341003|nr:fructosamine kinase family protein [Haladaptatus sp. DYF46]